MKMFLCSLLLLCGLLLAACQPIQPPVAASAAAPPAAESGPVAELAGAFEVVQLIVDFAPGAWTPSHTHGGMLLVTVRNGDLTVRDEQGVEQTYTAGESFIEEPGDYLEIGNDGESLASVATIALLPEGAALTTTKEGVSSDNAPPGPTVVYQHSQVITEPLGDFELLQLISDFAPGAWTPPHMHGGMLVVVVMNGELIMRDEGGEHHFKAGDSFVEMPGVYMEIGNDGESVASVATAALLPAGAKLTTVKDGISTDNVPPGPTLLYQYKLPAHSVAAP
jgi:quercetin dioxygenase-like cupin family protein